MLYGTKATKPAKYHNYKEEKPVLIPDNSYSFMTYRGGLYERVGDALTSPKDKKKRRIEVSSGTDIRMLAYLLGMNSFWEPQK